MKRKRKVKLKLAAFPLKDMLQRLGWSQRKLALASGIDLSQINSLATGKVNPKWPTILRIATTIGADLGDLAPGKGGAA